MNRGANERTPEKGLPELRCTSHASGLSLPVSVDVSSGHSSHPLRFGCCGRWQPARTDTCPAVAECLVHLDLGGWPLSRGCSCFAVGRPESPLADPRPCARSAPRRGLPAWHSPHSPLHRESGGRTSGLSSRWSRNGPDQTTSSLRALRQDVFSSHLKFPYLLLLSAPSHVGPGTLTMLQPEGRR